MATCPRGHSSVDEEFCDECGLEISPAATVVVAAAPQPTLAGPRQCPACGAPLDDRFCEDCGADSLAMPAPVEQPPVEEPPAVPTVVAPKPSTVQTWSVTVSADRKYYESVKADGGPDADSIVFPPYCPDRHFPLHGHQVSVGRRSATRGIMPDIDLTGPPEDPGVSRMHALLVANAEGGWAIVDMNSANGTTVNYRKDLLKPNTPRPLADGDKVHVGAWTTITLTADHMP